MAQKLAEKHRPKRLSELIGQPAIVTTLRNSVEHDNLHHTYLFHGSLGTGKTTLSRILAAMVNCENGPTAEPCGKCQQCKAIFATNHNDVEELDAASGGKIDEIRKLKKTIYYSPIAGARKKVYIIDECLPYEAKIELRDRSRVSIGELVEDNLKKSTKKSVMGYDIKRKKVVYRRVKRYIKIFNDKQMYELEIQGLSFAWEEIRTVRITGNHKIFSNGTYTEVKNVKTGEQVIVDGKATGRIIGIEKVEYFGSYVYNLEVEADEENKNYFADGLLVSNCHSLSSDGEEALLKVIEEPPPHVMFILCTTALQKMRDTIISRSQCHSFQKVYWTQILEHVSEIAKKEKAKIDEPALKLCAVLARGSVRDGLQYLDQLISYAGGKKITGEMAREAFCVVDEDNYYKLLSCIIGESGKPNVTEGYRLLNNILVGGSDPKVFLQGLDEHLRCLMIMLTAPQAADLLTITDEEKKRAKVEATHFDIAKVNDLLTHLNEVYRWLNYNVPMERLLDQWLIKSIITCHLKDKAKETVN